ncbi:hypothetical protein EST38_g10360 [Candolleomyces aberdarensis]|uniref:Uncharacterized protein n=1 Tax=Candolleomyces aberdarensis TaxID=2316362 RepID=A0A4Q2DAH0_9AGAR|nr:hypothetical protein EST38_g10360 [Candolleomyces aberdarensis]
MANVDFSRVHATPGLGQPLGYVPAHDDPLYVRGPIDNALDEENLCSLELITLREIAMLKFINLITDKQEWHKKVGAIIVSWFPTVEIEVSQVFDDNIVVKWRAEVESSGEDFTEKMFEYCIQEVRYRAERFEPNGSERGAIVVFNGKVVKSDYAVSEGVKLALQNAIRSLESVPEAQKDWHPGSDGKVLDLVHPSLYPLVYGKTKVLAVGSQVTTLVDCISRCGEGAVIPTPILPEPTNTRPYYSFLPRSTYDPYSTKFQWLPCEVDISGDCPKIISYINNLHPEKHQDLYHSIEDVIEAAIPLWEISIAGINLENRYSGAPSFRRIDWWENNRTLVIPEPTLPFDSEGYKLANSDVLNLRDVYGKGGRPLQIIVKLANIQLTPEKPKYEGGTWHVEGKLNEHICATAIYYHSCSNITDSSLAFRQVISDEDAEEDIEYEQHDHAWLEPIFGCAQDEAKVQEVGAVKTLEDRLIAFPNILQHQVQPFELADRTKPGHRKIVALFLVDPNVRVISTASVPCQQLEWWKEANIAQSVQTPPSSRSRLESLPVEVQDQVFEQVQDFPISLEEAKELRLELMEERKTFVLANAKMLEERTFSLCEH